MVVLGEGGVSYERGTPVREPLLTRAIGAVADRGGLSFLRLAVYRGTSLTRKRTPLGAYRRLIPRGLGGSYEGERFLLSEIPLT